MFLVDNNNYGGFIIKKRMKNSDEISFYNNKFKLMKNKQDLKQSKISRHQNAKQKFRFFERSLSTNSLNNKKEFIPIPGQFAILSNKKQSRQSIQLPTLKTQQGQLRQKAKQESLKFTTNLKLITRQRSPSRVSEVLTETVNRKVTEQQTPLRKLPRSASSTNIRPYTAEISTQLANELEGKNSLQQSRAVVNAMEYDKKYYIKKQLNQGNTFIVKSRTGIPKHVYGFKSIRLTQEDTEKKLKIETQHEIRPEGRKFTKIPIEVKSKQDQKYQQELPITEKNQNCPNFLPIEYYMMDDMRPDQLIQKYSMEDNYMVGYSKWQNVQGNYEWRKCRIIGYLKDRERWQIQWLHNGKNKIVGRSNLYFEKEDFAHFKSIIKNAEEFRKRSEVFMKYNWLIDRMTSSTHQIQDTQLTNIIKLLGKFIPPQVVEKLPSLNDKPFLAEGKRNNEKLANQLINQIKHKYIRANHSVQFNSSLPYSIKYKQQFRGYLPESYFTPNSTHTKFTLTIKHQLKSQREIHSKKVISEEGQSSQKVINTSTSVYTSFDMKKIFQQGQKKFLKITALTSIYRIQIIEFLNKSEVAIVNLRVPPAYEITYSKDQVKIPQNQLKYFAFYSNKLYDLDEVHKKLQGSLFDSLTRMNTMVCEVQYCISKEMDPIYLDRKTVGYENFDDMVCNYRRFLMTVNMRIQKLGRQVLLGMMRELAELLKGNQSIIEKKEQQQFWKTLQNQKSSHRELKIKVLFELKSQSLECSPSMQNVISWLQGYAKKLIDKFGNLSCIRKSYIDELRPGNKMKICQSLEEDNQENHRVWRENKQLMIAKNTLQQVISQCKDIYNEFYSKTRGIVDKVINLQSEIRKKNWKKCTFGEIEQYRRVIAQVKQSLVRLKMLSVNSTLIFNPINNIKPNITSISATPSSGTKRLSERSFLQSANTTNRQLKLSSRQLDDQQAGQDSRSKFQQMLQQSHKQNSYRFIKVGVFIFQVQQVVIKVQMKLIDLQKQLYKLLVQKIYRQSEKIQKQLQQIKQKVEEQPKNIRQMIQLEHYLNEQAQLELNKVINKMIEIQHNFTLIQSTQLDYKDYYDCHKVILKPLKIRTLMTQKLALIQAEYRKKFGEQLMKEVAELTHEMKEIQDKFYATTTITSLQEMNASFMAFSKLKERIENALAKSVQVNDYQTAMKWMNTSFQRLVEIKDQFMPYYQLITLEKNYTFHLNLQLNQPLHTIDAKKIAQDVLNAINQLTVLEFEIFTKNPVMLEIVKNVAHSYKNFKEKLPLLQILRNPDLRQRHWNSIKELTTYNDILSDKITFTELEKRDIKRFEKKLIELSHIATRELIYEKKLNKMKKQWKQLKIQTKIIPFHENKNQAQNNNSSSALSDIRIITNLDEIKTKTQNDIYQIQEILASSFIKFLQKDVLLWRNHTLYKMYEFIEIWKVLEKWFIPLWKMFSKSAIKNQAPNEYQKFKALEKNWRNLTQTIEQQPNVIQLLQTKINDSIKYTVELIDELKKAVSEFFETKKQKFSRFGALSQDQLIALYSNSNQEKEVFDQAVRKCLQGVKGVVRNKKRITMVKTHLDEEIFLNQAVEAVEEEDEQEEDDLSPDKIIEDIEKKIKRSLRSCIDEIQQKSAKILQIVLFNQRIIFTREIENQLIDSSDNSDDGPGIKQGYMNALIGLKSKIITVLLEGYNKGGNSNNNTNAQQNQIKIQAELNQLINHLEIAEWLYINNVTETFDFEWISQIRTYHNSGNYTVHCGLNKTEYGFQITDQQNYIVEKNSMRVFCHLSMTTMQRMFNMVSGKVGQGKLALLHYLANIHGRNQLVMNCHQAISYDNIIDSFRMCATGIWIVFNNLNLLTPQVLSVFAQALQLLWVNYPTQKSKGYLMLGEKNVMFTTHEINLFATINTSKINLDECSQISAKLSTYFRTYSVPTLDVKYILEGKLILAGFECQNSSRFFHMIELIENECEIFYQKQQQQEMHIQGSLNFSKLNFIQKVIKYAKEFKEKRKTMQIEIEEFVFLQQGLEKAIFDITLNLPELKEGIFYKLTNYFDFFPKNIQISSQHQKRMIESQGSNKDNNKILQQNESQIKLKIKKLFSDNKLYCSNILIQKYWSILKTLQQKHSVIILGECSTGKSQLINVLQKNRITLKRGYSIMSNNLQDTHNYVDNFKIELTYLHPNAYSLTELFGDVNRNGAVNSLIKKAYERLNNQKVKDEKQEEQQKKATINQEEALVQQQQHQKQQQVFTNIGLVFDSQIGPWIEPLLPLIKSSNTYIQPNGKTVLIQHPLKLIFQCRNLSSVSPSIILATNIVHMDSNSIRWQHMFAQYLRTHFDQQRFKQKVFLDYCESLITFVLEPTLQFFKSSVTNFNAKMTARQTSNNNKTLSSNNGQQNIFIEQIYNSFLKNEANFVPLIFNLFIALVQSHYDSLNEKQPADRANKQKRSVFSSLISTQKVQTVENTQLLMDDKNRSIIFNLFVMGITWTVGLMIPEESKKTFSRHFKYLIKRAIQLNIKNIEKESLPKDQEDIYELCFINDKWYTWEEVISQRAKIKLTINESNNFSMVNWDRDSVPMKTKFKYKFLFEKYSQACQSFYLLGKSSTGKNALMLDFISKLPQQSYNSILLTCTPQTTHKHAKRQLKKQIQKQKYSHTFEGFVNGKYTLFYLCDMNLPLKNSESSLNEFVHQYVKSQGWYLNFSSEFFRFKNVVFCGTLNSGLAFSEQLIRFINPISYVESDSDIRMTLFSILNTNELISPYGEKLVKLMMNLQEVICREFKHKGAGRSISFRDQCEIAENLSFKVTGRLFTSNTKGSQRSMKLIQGVNANESVQKMNKNRILQCWIMQTQQKYQQVMGPEYDQEKIYYFINNVLMEEQRTRYKSILPKSDFFLSNISYYASKISVIEKSSTRKSKHTKTFLLPHSYKVYEGLPSIKEQIQNLETYVDKTFTQLDETDRLQKKFSFKKQIRLAISSKKHPKTATSYLRSMQCLLNFFLQEKTRLIILVNENDKTTRIEQKQQIESTIKQLLDFEHQNKTKTRNNIEQKNRNDKKKEQRSDLQKLFRFTTNINKSHVVSFQHPNSSHENHLEWKMFLSQLFELINSPLSNELNDYYVVYIKGIKDSERFILEEFLGLIRTGALKVLEDYISSEEFELEELDKHELQGVIKHEKPPLRHESIIEEQSLDQSVNSQSQQDSGKRLQEENRKIQEMKKKSIAQLMRQKVMKKIKFVIQLNDDEMQKLKQNYSVLFEKSHMLWSSQLVMSFSAGKNAKNQFEVKGSQKEISSVASGSRKSLTSQMMALQINNDETSMGVKQDDHISMMRKEYNDHKQSLSHLLSFNQVRRVYFSLLEDTITKEGLSQIEREIQSGENSEFLQFLNLRKNLQDGVQSRAEEKIKSIDQQLQYITVLSTTLLQQLLSLISQQSAFIQSKESQLALMAQTISKLSQQNEKFLKQFLNLQNSIILLQSQSRESNELYHQSIRREQKNFFACQFLLIDMLKTAKDKKIFMTNEMKAYLELFGLIINKKVKPEESMIKEIVKDIGALKVHKKVANIFVQPPIGQKLVQKQSIIGQKALGKLKQFVTKNLAAQLAKYTEIKEQYSYSNDKMKQSSFSQNLLNLLKDYFLFFVIFYNKTQEEPVKQLNKKCAKTIKQLGKTKDQFSKSQKNKNYQKVTNDLEEMKKKRASLLQSYDLENKYLQTLLSIQKKALEVNCLSINGQIDQNMVALKSSLETLMNHQFNERTKNLVIQRIKAKFQKQRQCLISIRNCKQVISLMIACRFKINQSQIQDTKMGSVTKIVSRQAMDKLQGFRIPVWEQLFDEKGKRDEESEKSQKAEIIRYFIQEFDLKKAFKLLNGIVFASIEYELKWVRKSQAQKLLTCSPNLSSQTITNTLLEEKENQHQYQNNDNSSIFSKTAFLTDFSSMEEIKELLHMIGQNQNLVDLLSNDHKIIIFIDEELISQMPSVFQAQNVLVNNLNRMNINFLEFDNKKSQSQAKLLYLFQEKLEEELCLDKKDNDSKLLSHWKELKQSQVENQQEAKSLIKNFHVFDVLILSQKQKRENQQTNINDATKIEPIHLSQSQRSSQHLNKLLAHLSELTQTFLEYASISSQLSSIASTSSLKKKSNIFTTKLLKYLSRVYQGLQILKSEGLILTHYKLERFLNTVSDIVHYEKDKQKNQLNQGKLFKCVKNKLFELMTIAENHRKLFIALIFALSGEELLTEKDFDKLIRTIIKMYMFSVKLLHVDSQLLLAGQSSQSKTTTNSTECSQDNNNEAAQIVKNLVLKSGSTFPHHGHQKAVELKLQLSSTFEEILERLEVGFPVFKDLKQNVKKKINPWIKFFTAIQTKLTQSNLQTLPQPYNDINRVYFGIFVALLCPSKLQFWLDIHLFEEDLVKISDMEIMSNETRILNIIGNKFNTKQTVIIGDESLKLLTSLATRTKKTLRLYSRLNLNDNKQTSVDKDITSSKPVSRRQISLLPQVTFFTERKISQQIIDELQNCMKSSTWLIIDLKGLIKQNQSSTEKYSNIDILVKVIDSLTNPHAKNSSGGDSEKRNSEQSLFQALSSSTSLKNTEFGKNDFNPAAFAAYDYHIFFIVPKYLKRQIFELTNLSKNNKRFIMQLREENDFSRYFSLNKLYHQELMSSKKMIKEYENLRPLFKEIICSELYIIEQALQKSLPAKMNFKFVNLLGQQSISKKCGLQFKKAKQIVEKLSKMLMIILQDPEIVKQIFSFTSKTIRKIPISTYSIPQQQQPVHIPSNKKIESKIATQFYRSNTKKKATIKLMLKQTEQNDNFINEKDHLKDDKYNHKQLGSRKSIGSKKSLFDNMSSLQQKEEKVRSVLKLMFNYLMASLDQKQLCTASLTYFMTKYENEKIEEGGSTNLQKNNELHENKKNIIKIISNPEPRYNSNKFTLQELAELLNSINDKKIKHTQSLLNVQVTKILLLSKSRIQSNKFSNFKFLLERGLELKNDQIHSQKFLNIIQSLNETKKQLQSSIIQIKTQFFPTSQITQQSSQNQSKDQFNFSSLTQNLTLQEMRKKLNITDMAISKNASNNLAKKAQQNLSKQNLIGLLLKLHSNVVEQIDRKVQKLRNLKTVFLLGNINYQLLKDWWTKNVAFSEMGNEIIEILRDLDRHKEQNFVNELQKIMQFMRNPKSFLISQFNNLPPEMLPVFNLELLNETMQLDELIHQLKCTFLEINKLKNQHIKIHLMIDKDHRKDNKKLIVQETNWKGRQYKICGFTQFGVSGLVYSEQKSRGMNPVVFSDNTNKESCNSRDYKNENLRLTLCFEVCDQEDATQSQNQGSQYQQEETCSAIKQLQIPFFMRQCRKKINNNSNNGNNNEQHLLSKKIGMVTISVIRNLDIEQCQKRERFFVYY